MPSFDKETLMKGKRINEWIDHVVGSIIDGPKETWTTKEIAKRLKDRYDVKTPPTPHISSHLYFWQTLESLKHLNAKDMREHFQGLAEASCKRLVKSGKVKEVRTVHETSRWKLTRPRAWYD